MKKTYSLPLLAFVVGVALGLVACQSGDGRLKSHGKEAAGRIVDAITDRVIEEIDEIGTEDFQEPASVPE